MLQLRKNEKRVDRVPAFGHRAASNPPERAGRGAGVRLILLRRGASRALDAAPGIGAHAEYHICPCIRALARGC